MREDKLKNPRRRKFLGAAASAAAGATVSCSARRSSWRSLSVEEAATLAAICDLIVPSDDYPGAVTAGATEYIDRQLDGHFKRLHAAYRRGLAGVDETSAEMFRAKFVALSKDQRIAVLKAMEKDKAPGEIWKTTSAKEFFGLLISHTMQGFYGDPRHGGNRDGVSWRMLGVSLSPIRGRSQHDLTQAPPQGGAL